MKFTLFLFILCGCHYHTDKLQVINNSEHDIYYRPMLRDPLDGKYYACSAGGLIESKSKHSPKLIGQISYAMNQKTSDKILYVVFFDKKDLMYVLENEKKIMFNNKFKIQKFTLVELNNLNWKIKYVEK